MRLLITTLLLVAQASAPIFRFEADGFWLNLHHFLYVLGRAQNGAPDAKRRAVEAAPADQVEGLKGLSEADRKAWADAVTFYANGLSKQDPIFDRDLITVTNAMRVPPTATSKALKVDAALLATLDQAAPIYRRVWWPRHQKANNESVREFAGYLGVHGDKVLAYITKAYQEPWPKSGHQINVSGYTNWAGAYSTDGGLIVISSLDEGTRGSLGLESMFHEAMHQWDQPMMARLSRLSKEHQTPPPREGITHALIWYTAAEAVKSVIPAHVGYAESGGMWRQKGLGSFKAGLDAHWKPYLEGKTTLDAALVGLLKS
jgi:hypothetical protein